MSPSKKKADRAAYHAVWPTAWGPMGGVADAEGALIRVVLPHYQAQDLRELLAWEHPASEANDEPFAELARLALAYFSAERVDFDGVAVALPSEKSFSGRVLRAARAIPYGQSVSYGELAKQIDQPDAARAVATAMSKNPTPLVVPCHRVRYSGGGAGGFSAEGGVALKQRMLDLEARVSKG